MANFNQVACDECWAANNPDRRPFKMIGVIPMEQCSWCGKQTNSGIFVRADPKSVPFPQPDES